MGERMPSTGFSGRLRVASRALTGQTSMGRDTDMILAALRIPLRNSLVEVLWSRRVVMMGGWKLSAQETAQSRSLGQRPSLSTHEERVLAKLPASKRLLQVRGLLARRPSSLLSLRAPARRRARRRRRARQTRGRRSQAQTGRRW